MTSVSKPHFQSLIALWSKLQLPLRPQEPVPSTVAALLPKGRRTRLLLMGVTPDYVDLTDDLTAIDWSAEMIAHVWPGDTQTRRAELGDWRSMPFEADQFDAAVGDNSMSLLAYPGDLDQALGELRRVLRPGGRAVIRWFLAPDTAPTDTELVSFVDELDAEGADALRWRFAIDAVHSADGQNVRVTEAYEKYTRLFPDLEKLAYDKGWDAGQQTRLELYRGSEMELAFPKREEMEAVARRHFDHIDYFPSGDYIMAEFAPLVVLS